MDDHKASVEFDCLANNAETSVPRVVKGISNRTKIPLRQKRRGVEASTEITNEEAPTPRRGVLSLAAPARHPNWPMHAGHVTAAGQVKACGQLVMLLRQVLACGAARALDFSPTRAPGGVCNPPQAAYGEDNHHRASQRRKGRQGAFPRRSWRSTNERVEMNAGSWWQASRVDGLPKTPS